MSTSEINTPLRTVAQLISILLHPVFMPLYSCLLLYGIAPNLFASVPAKQLYGWLGMVLINTLMFPLILMGLLKGLGFIKSIFLKEAKERIIPLIGVMVFYFWPYLVAKNVQAPEAARVLMLGNFWGVIAVFMCTIFFKISMHTSGVGSVLGFVIVLCILTGQMFVSLAACVLAAALLILWARKVLGAHSWKELLLGLVLGIAAQVGAMLYLH